MLKRIIVLAILSVAVNAHAEVYKCKGPDGKTQFSDTQCKVGSTSERMPDKAPITEQQRVDAQQRNLQLQREVSASESPRNPASQPTQSAPVASAPQTVPNDSDAISSCIRDVERQGTSQKVKAEMIVACQTAGQTQRASGRSGDAVSECVRSVERTGASGTDKARQLAMCHGGDVKEEHPHHRLN